MKALLLVLGLLPGLLFAQKHHARWAAIDVQHYTFAISLEKDGKTISVDETIVIRNRTANGAYQLDLVAEKGGKGMEVEKVWLLEENGKQKLSFEHSGDQLKIQLDGEKDAGTEVRLNILYSGIPKDGLVISKNRHGDRTYFGDNWPNRARNWLATVDHPSDKATVTWDVTVPEPYQVVANGVLAQEEALKKGRRYIYKCTVPLPTKVMVMAAAEFSVEEVGEVEGAKVSSWVFPEDKELGFKHYADALPILRTFVDSIAPFAYGKLANVQSKTRYGGMENAGCIFYFESSVDNNQIPLLAHEIAHQWFGNMATEADWHHIWLSEGFATYFTNLYVEWSQGRDAFQERMANERRTVLNYARQRMRPIVDTSVTNYNRLLNANSYQKGSWVLHQLRQEIGYTSFMKGVRLYYGRFGGKNALTKDLAAAMEAASGQELNWFFQQWIFRPGHPVVELEMRPGSGEIFLSVDQVQEQAPFRCWLEVELEFENGKRKTERLRLQDRHQEFEIAAEDQVKSITMDPHVNTLGVFSLKE